eukprot:TRINITY_DN5529_c0_g1_i7.p1 TRINITY_DN5529_c0_g1~~TRINITY_DN5529_c0_g1_i7.p1  ORF type:complete len:325 (+),score=52.82 TRINITY_DN5529_c0_g1_i7:418-1392(+)
MPDYRRYAKCNTIDLIYTWVNGSDPNHIAKRMQRSQAFAKKYSSTSAMSRFRDMSIMKYSLRSVLKFAPWIRAMWIVTDDQVPSWLNQSSHKVRVVFHRDIFTDQSALPTFNSNSIEANLHNLPDEVAECFVYLNDDMLFSNYATPSDFWREGLGQVMYESGFTAPAAKEKMSNSWHRSITRCNQLLDEKWNEKEVRHYASHGPYFFMRKSLRSLYHEFKVEWDATSQRPFRNEKDLTLPFMYQHHTRRYYASHVDSTGLLTYGKITNDYDLTKKELEKTWGKKTKVVCLNDGMDDARPDDGKVLDLVNDWFTKLFPVKPYHEL